MSISKSIDELTTSVYTLATGGSININLPDLLEAIIFILILGFLVSLLFNLLLDLSSLAFEQVRKVNK